MNDQKVSEVEGNHPSPTVQIKQMGAVGNRLPSRDRQTKEEGRITGGESVKLGIKD